MPKELPRGRQATETDCFLVTPADGSISEDNPVAVLPLTSAQEESVRAMIRQPSWYGNDDELPSEKEARQIFQAQCPEATVFQTDKASHSSYLPGKAPILDHLSVRVQHTPDWNCLPVVLMVGHVGCQVNIRLPITEQTGPRGELQLRIMPVKLQLQVLGVAAADGRVHGCGHQRGPGQVIEVGEGPIW
jgi:hypothetical protein